MKRSGVSCLPQRALAALKSFRDLIEDGRAMLAGTYVERLQETAWGQPPSAVQRGEALQNTAEPDPSDDTDFNPDNFRLDFGRR